MKCGHMLVSAKNGGMYCNHPEVLRIKSYNPYCVVEGIYGYDCFLGLKPNNKHIVQSKLELI